LHVKNDSLSLAKIVVSHFEERKY